MGWSYECKGRCRCEDKGVGEEKAGYVSAHTYTSQQGTHHIHMYVHRPVSSCTYHVAHLQPLAHQQATLRLAQVDVGEGRGEVLLFHGMECVKVCGHRKGYGGS